MSNTTTQQAQQKLTGRRAARIELDEVVDLVDRLIVADQNGCSHQIFEADQYIRDDAGVPYLRFGWHIYGEEMDPEEYQIMLHRNPDVRLTGRLDEDAKPVTHKYQYRDENGQWVDFQLDWIEYNSLRIYASRLSYDE